MYQNAIMGSVDGIVDTVLLKYAKSQTQYSPAESATKRSQSCTDTNMNNKRLSKVPADMIVITLQHSESLESGKESKGPNWVSACLDSVDDEELMPEESELVATDDRKSLQKSMKRSFLRSCQSQELVLNAS